MARLKLNELKVTSFTTVDKITGGYVASATFCGPTQQIGSCPSVVLECPYE